MKTIFLKQKDIVRKWYLIDADGKVLGRLATKVATILRGKHKPTYTPHMDVGDSVIIINAEKIKVTGKKRKEKMYYRHSGYPGGLKTVVFEKIVQKKPIFPLEHAIRGMLPKNSLGRKMFKNVKIYVGSEHPHSSQKPEKID